MNAYLIVTTDKATTTNIHSFFAINQSTSLHSNLLFPSSDFIRSKKFDHSFMLSHIAESTKLGLKYEEQLRQLIEEKKFQTLILCSEWLFYATRDNITRLKDALTRISTPEIKVIIILKNYDQLLSSLVGREIAGPDTEHITIDEALRKLTAPRTSISARVKILCQQFQVKTVYSEDKNNNFIKECLYEIHPVLSNIEYKITPHDVGVNDVIARFLNTLNSKKNDFLYSKNPNSEYQNEFLRISKKIKFDGNFKLTQNDVEKFDVQIREDAKKFKALFQKDTYFKISFRNKVKYKIHPEDYFLLSSFFGANFYLEKKEFFQEHCEFSKKTFFQFLEKNDKDQNSISQISRIFSIFDFYETAVNFEIKQILRTFFSKILLESSQEVKTLDESDKIKLNKLIKDSYFHDALLILKNLELTFSESSEMKTYQGNIFRKLNRISDAIYMYEEGIKINPFLKKPYIELANIYLSQRNFVEAKNFFIRASLIDIDDPHVCEGVILSLFYLKKFDQALLYYNIFNKEIRGRSNILNNIGLCCQKLNNFEQSIDFFEKSIKENPLDFFTYFNLGNSLKAINKFEECLFNFKKSIEINPRFSDGYFNIANTLRDLNRFEEAVNFYNRCIDVDPINVKCLFNLAKLMASEGKFDTSIFYYSEVIRLEPNHAEAHWNRSRVRLLIGNFNEGWKDYEWRYRRYLSPQYPEVSSPRLTSLDQVPGSTVFVFSEQGLGDTIQFSRFLIPLLKLGAKIIFLPQVNLINLIKMMSFYTKENVKLVSSISSKDRYDYHIPLLSLPNFFFNSEFFKFDYGKYLQTPANTNKFNDKINSNFFNIAICWRGQPSKIDEGRSFPLKFFEKIAQIPNVKLISVHKGFGENEIDFINFSVTTFDENFDKKEGAFIDTIRVLTSCDLIITSDTSIAHLSGALNLPTWVVLQKWPDWRWGVDDNSSVWYENVRLFRQKKKDDWTSVFNELYKSLTRVLNLDKKNGK